MSNVHICDTFVNSSIGLSYTLDVTSAVCAAVVDRMSTVKNTVCSWARWVVDATNEKLHSEHRLLHGIEIRGARRRFHARTVRALAYTRWS